jgi:hypothetical protein
MKRLEAPSGVTAPGPFAKMALAVGGVLVLAAGIVFSVAAFAVALVAGTAALGWIAWKTRALRRAVRDEIAAQRAAGLDRGAPHGRVIEGEAVSIPDERR